jgi:uncharacterized protein
MTPHNFRCCSCSRVKRIARKVDRSIRGRCQINAASPSLLTSGAKRSIHLAFAAAVLFAVGAHAAEVIPPKPPGYFNDYAGVVSKSTALELNEQLAQFERDTSNQIWVAIYPKMQSDSDIADYTRRVAQSWQVGQKGKNNGAVLFVFIEDRKMFIPTGYGVEGALPDFTAKDITENLIKPHFKKGDYTTGLTAGVTAMLQAVRGEYKGSGQTALETRDKSRGARNSLIGFVLFIILLIIISRLARRAGGYSYSSGGGPFFFPVGGGGGGWSGGSSGRGGGFSGSLGGGGSFGGGGAGSSW